MPRNPTLHLPYPYNLLADVFARGSDFSDFPADVAVAVEYVLLQLTEREQTIVSHRYLERMTLRAIAEKHGLTTERIRQILTEAIFKIRHPSRSDILRRGISGILDLVRQQAFDAGYAKGYEEGYTKGFAQAKAAQTGTEYVERPYDSWPIEDLDLSVRAYNCLFRANIRTVQQISVMTYDELYRLRNMGIKSLNEIVQKMADLGYDTSAMAKPKK